jgi:hypothetical protein
MGIFLLAVSVFWSFWQDTALFFAWVYFGLGWIFWFGLDFFSKLNGLFERDLGSHVFIVVFGIQKLARKESLVQLIKPRPLANFGKYLILIKLKILERPTSGILVDCISEELPGSAVFLGLECVYAQEVVQYTFEGDGLFLAEFLFHEFHSLTTSSIFNNEQKLNSTQNFHTNKVYLRYHRHDHSLRHRPGVESPKSAADSRDSTAVLSDSVFRAKISIVRLHKIITAKTH